jgi:hypothetical protein
MIYVTIKIYNSGLHEPIQAHTGPYRPIQAHTGPYRHFKNMKMAFYNRNGQNMLAKNIFYINPNTMIHVVIKIYHSGLFRPIQAFQKHVNRIYFL